MKKIINKAIFLGVLLLSVFVLSIDNELWGGICCEQIDVNIVFDTTNCCVKVKINNPACYNFNIDVDNLGSNTSYELPQGDSIEFNICNKNDEGKIVYTVYLNIDNSPACANYYFEGINKFSGEVDASSCCPSCKSANTSDWFVLDVEYGDPECPYACKVTPRLNLPENATCYKYIKDYGYGSEEEDTNKIVSVSEIEFPSRCIKTDEECEWYISLLKDKDDDPLGNKACILSAEATGCKKEFKICTPDCEETPFDSIKTLIFVLDKVCPRCSVQVTFTWRKACKHWQDLQILEMRYLEDGPCKECVIHELYANVIGAIIATSHKNSMDFEPKNADSCFSQWRISNASCWVKTIIGYHTGYDGQVTWEIAIYDPCPCLDNDCGCCLQQLKVCRINDDEVNITPVGPPSPQAVCLGETCIPTCEWAGLVNGTYGHVIQLSPQMEGLGKYNIADDDNIFYKVTGRLNNEQENLELKIYYKTNAKAYFHIYDIIGNEIATIEYDLNRGENVFNYSTKKLLSGTYIYNLTVDNKEIYSDQFILIK